MRRVGLVLLVLGLAGFFFATAQKARYEKTPAEGPLSLSRDAAVYQWETARWLLAGVGVIGVVFTILPGKKSKRRR